MDSEEELGSGDFPRAPDNVYMQRLAKCQRAPRFEKDVMRVEYIENSQLVYLQYPWQHANRLKLDRSLADIYPSLPLLPPHLRVPDQVCVIRNLRRGGMARRAVIVDETTVLLVDYGRYVKCLNVKVADLRLLPANGLMAAEPMVSSLSPIY